MKKRDVTKDCHKPNSKPFEEEFFRDGSDGCNRIQILFQIIRKEIVDDDGDDEPDEIRGEKQVFAEDGIPRPLREGWNRERSVSGFLGLVNPWRSDEEEVTVLAASKVFELF